MQGWPLRTFLPAAYEPNYAYPLLVFLHGQGGSEEQVLRLAPRLSRRNYICIALRGPHTVTRPDGTPGYGWGPDGRPTPRSRTTSSAPCPDTAALPRPFRARLPGRLPRGRAQP